MDVGRRHRFRVLKPGLRCEQEVLRTDTGSGDWGWGGLCVARTSLVVQEGGMGEKPGTGGDCWAGRHSMCPLCNPGIEVHSGPGWRHLGNFPLPNPELGVLLFPG